MLPTHPPAAPTRAPRLRGPLLACIILTGFGVVAFLHQLRQVQLARQAIGSDAVQQANAAQVAIDALLCRRFEKDVFFNLNDPQRKSEYLTKWKLAYRALEADVAKLRDCRHATGYPPIDALQPERLVAYRNHFLQVLADVGAPHISPTRPAAAPTAENANQAMEPFKEDARALAETAILIADESSRRAARAGENLVQRASLSVLLVSLLTITPGIMIFAVFRRYNRSLLTAHEQLQRYTVELARREERERQARHQELEARSAFERAAMLDQLTGLPNRALFVDRLQHAIARARRRPQRTYAVMFLDFDRFKLVNDSLGHDVGDLFLIEVATRLTAQLRGVDSVCRDAEGNSAGRLGGDEFVVLLDDLASPDDALRVAERLLEDFSRPVTLGKHEVLSTASIGIVIGDQKYERAEDVLRDADTAMYEAKRGGRRRYVVFDESMRQRVLRRTMLENDLRKAIHGNQLSLVYQPILCLSSGAVYGVEGLLRWQHPTEGLIGPAEFIPIAEESHLILDLGEWVLREGCRQLADWVRRLGDEAPPIVSLNLSRKQFARADLPALIQNIISEHFVDPSRIQLEVTEDALATDVAAAAEAMQAIKAIGVRLALDDFGTGCSSFASLHQFPVDVLKVDRSIMTGIEISQDAAALVHALAVLVHNLGITMVSEGIEEASQVVALQELGCQYGQGFFFARPMLPSDLELFLQLGRSAEYSVDGASIFANRWEDRLPNFTPLSAE